MELLAKAVIEVMKAVKGMEKNSHVGNGYSAYDGTKDSDVKEVFNESMAKNGLCILPIDVTSTEQIDRWEEEDSHNKGQMKTKQSVFTKVTTKYLLLHESGQSLQVAGLGHGTDPQDKGAGKATTYALKNLLLNMFLTPVGKMPDTDTTHSDDIDTAKTKTQQKKAETPPPFVGELENCPCGKPFSEANKIFFKKNPGLEPLCYPCGQKKKKGEYYGADLVEEREPGQEG